MHTILGEMEASVIKKSWVENNLLRVLALHLVPLPELPQCLLLKGSIQHAAWHPFNPIILTSCTLTFPKMHILQSNWTQYWPPFPQGPPVIPPHSEPHFVYCS